METDKGASNVKRRLLNASYRRRLLDRDLAEVCSSLQGLVLDLGGEWQQRPGTFRPLQRTDLRWIGINLSPAAAPDVLGDVTHAPIADTCADAVVCTEVLEHDCSGRPCAQRYGQTASDRPPVGVGTANGDPAERTGLA